MDIEARDQLIQQFEAFLDDYQTSESTRLDVTQADQFSLLTELTTLKAEVKQESRYVKEALDQFKSAYQLLQDENERLTEALEKQRLAQVDAWKGKLKPVLEDLLDLCDRMEAGTAMSLDRQPINISWFNRDQVKNRLEAMTQGQQMTWQKMTEMLSKLNVIPMQVVGSVFDPHRMKAVDIEKKMHLADGEVISEIRKGYLWDDNLLRTADVVVNKK